VLVLLSSVVGVRTLETMDDQKIIKILNLTTSDSDGECANAIRKVNQLLKKEDIGWDSFVKRNVNNRVRLIKFLNLTTSDSDGECVNAMRRANKIIKVDNNSTWEDSVGNSRLRDRFGPTHETGGTKTRYGKPPFHNPFEPPNHANNRSSNNLDDLLRAMMGGAIHDFQDFASASKKAGESFTDIGDIASALNSLFGQRTSFTRDEYFKAKKHASAGKRQEKPYTKKERNRDDNESEPDNYAEFDDGSEEITFFNMDDDELVGFLRRKCTSRIVKEKQIAHEILQSYYSVGSFYHVDKIKMRDTWEIKQ